MSTPDNSQPTRLINGGSGGYKIRFIFKTLYADSDFILDLVSEFGDKINSLTAKYNDLTEDFPIVNASDLKDLEPADFLDIVFTLNSHPGEIIQWITKKIYPGIVETLLLTTDYKAKSYVIGSKDFSEMRLNRVDLRCLAAPFDFSYADSLFTKRLFFDYSFKEGPLSIPLTDRNERISKTIARLHCFNPDIRQCHLDKYDDDSYFKKNGYDLLVTDFTRILNSDTEIHPSDKEYLLDFIHDRMYFFSFTCIEGSFRHMFSVSVSPSLFFLKGRNLGDSFSIIYYHKVESIPVH